MQNQMTISRLDAMDENVVKLINMYFSEGSMLRSTLVNCVETMMANTFISICRITKQKEEDGAPRYPSGLGELGNTDTTSW